MPKHTRQNGGAAGGHAANGVKFCGVYFMLCYSSVIQDGNQKNFTFFIVTHPAQQGGLGVCESVPQRGGFGFVLHKTIGAVSEITTDATRRRTPESLHRILRSRALAACLLLDIFGIRGKKGQKPAFPLPISSPASPDCAPHPPTHHPPTLRSFVPSHLSVPDHLSGFSLLNVLSVCSTH